MNRQLKNLIERVLIARPDASNAMIRNVVPPLCTRSDDEIDKIVGPIRAQLVRANHQAGKIKW